MKIEMARMGVFLVFLLAAAWQDFGTKQISSEILWLSGTAALVCQSLSVLCLAFIKEAGAEETVLWFFLNAWGPYLAGVLPGAALLALSWLGCGIGAGDGFFFLVSGLLLGLRHNLLFLCGTVLLYRGLIWQNRKWMAFAGVCLGASVLTRLPNIVECALIIAVFYYGILKKKKVAEIWKDVAACVIGFVAAFLVGFLAISLQFRFDAYPKMLVGLAGYSGTDETYSSLSMITSVVSAYVEAFKWVLILGIAALLGTVLFFLFPGKFEKGKMVLYLCMLPVLLRFLWGRGMFNLQYAFYWSVFEWCMVLLYVAIGLCIWTLADPLVFRRDKLLSLMVLLVILITPIGSNNETYPNMNNLFLVAPVTFWMGYRLLLKLRRLPYSFACRAMLVCVAVVFLIQSTGFGVRAVFRDSIEGQKRDTRVVNCKKLSGAKTNRANAEQLQDVVDYYAEHADELEENSRLLTFGDVPGFCWLFDLPSALSHDWPDMNTYPAETMRTDLEALSQAGEKPLVILCPGKVDTEDAQETQKWELLQEFLAQNAYEMKLDNGTYQIYE